MQIRTYSQLLLQIVIASRVVVVVVMVVVVVILTEKMVLEATTATAMQTGQTVAQTFRGQHIVLVTAWADRSIDEN